MDIIRLKLIHIIQFLSQVFFIMLITWETHEKHAFSGDKTHHTHTHTHIPRITLINNKFYFTFHQHHRQQNSIYLFILGVNGFVIIYVWVSTFLVLFEWRRWNISSNETPRQRDIFAWMNNLSGTLFFNILCVVACVCMCVQI